MMDQCDDALSNLESAKLYSYLNSLMVFPTFFNLSLNLAIRSSWSEPRSGPRLVFVDKTKLLYRGSPYLAAKNTINFISVLTIWWCPCVESSLVLLEEGVCYDQCVLLAKKKKGFALLHSISKAKFTCYSRCFLTSYCSIPVPYNEKDIFCGC